MRESGGAGRSRRGIGLRDGCRFELPGSLKHTFLDSSELTSSLFVRAAREVR